MWLNGDRFRWRLVSLRFGILSNLRTVVGDPDLENSVLESAPTQVQETEGCC